MGDLNLHVDVEKLLSFGDDLIGVLKKKKDGESFRQSIEGQKTINDVIRSDLEEVQSSLEEHQKKVSSCKEKIETVKSETTTTEAEIEHLQNELELKFQKVSMLCEELRTVQKEVESLKHKRTANEKVEKALKKSEKDLLPARDILSMYASVTNIIPKLDDQTIISGCILSHKKDVVTGNKKKAKKFSVMPSSPPFDTCNKLWKFASKD